MAGLTQTQLEKEVRLVATYATAKQIIRMYAVNAPGYSCTSPMPWAEAAEAVKKILGIEEGCRFHGYDIEADGSIWNGDLECVGRAPSVSEAKAMILDWEK